MAESIFHGVVACENAFTQLLCNLMKRDEKFRDEVVALLGGKVTQSGLKIIPQKRLPDGCGQPDLRIESEELCVIVEVKTNSRTSTTSKQLASDAEYGYLPYLNRQKGEAKDVALTFLVPRAWEGKLPKSTNGVIFRRVEWETILELLEDRMKRTQEGQPLFEEFRLLLIERFGPITFDEEEIRLMFSQQYPIANFLKLYAVLEALRRKAKGTRGKLSFDNDEAGFSLGNGANTLFVGCCASLWDSGFHHPICFGVEDRKRSVSEAFSAACEEQSLPQPEKFGEWLMSGLTRDDIEGFDAADGIWAKLKPIWAKVKDAAK